MGSKPKIQPQQLAIIMLTLVALVLPLTAISLATAQYLKARREASRQPPAAEIKGMEEQLDAALSRQLKTFESKAPKVTLYGMTWDQARSFLQETARSEEGVFALTGDKTGTIFVKQKRLAAMLGALSKRDKNVVVEGNADPGARTADDWVAVDVVYEMQQ